MSAGGGAGGALVAGMVAALRAHAGLAGCAVFDAAPVRGGLPYAEVGEPALGDWSGVGWTGREGRIAVAVVDGGERPVRLRALAAAVEGGWRRCRPRSATGGAWCGWR